MSKKKIFMRYIFFITFLINQLLLADKDKLISYGDLVHVSMKEDQEVVYEGEDLLGRVLQHELDHLNGKLLLSALKRKERKQALKDISIKGFPGDQI